MVPHVRRAVLFVSPGKTQAELLAEKIAAELNSLDIETDTFPSNVKPALFRAAYDVAITLGGDGTVLSAARLVSPENVPIFPVNLGTFGFIAGVQPLEWREVFDRWINGEALISRRLMLTITVTRGARQVFAGCCLNEAVVSASSIARIIKLHVFCGDASGLAGVTGSAAASSGGTKFLELGPYRSDGLIVATPTGSTAYSASAGGPVVDPELEAMILNPVCPFTLTHRPLILPADETLMMEVDEGQREKVLFTVDGQIIEKLKSGDRIYISKAPNPCLLIASGREVFFHALKTKLAWVGGTTGENFSNGKFSEGSHD